jgi:hypothetical protein
MNDLGVLIFCVFYLMATSVVFAASSPVFTTLTSEFSKPIAINSDGSIFGAIAGFFAYLAWAFDKVFILAQILFSGLFLAGNIIFTIVNSFIVVLMVYFVIKMLKGWL